MRRTAPLFSAALLALILTACSSGDGDKASSTTTAPATEGGSATTLTNDPYCQTLQRFNERYGQVNPALADPERLKGALQDTMAMAQEAQNNAPENLKGDFATLSTGLQQLIDLFGRVNYDVTKLQLTDIDRLQSNPELEAASRRIEAYTRDHCL